MFELRGKKDFLKNKYIKGKKMGEIL